MDRAIRDLLEGADHPVHDEGDPDRDWEADAAEVAGIKPELERIAGRAFVLDDRVQDASFFADLSIQRQEAGVNLIETVFAVRFSSFGRLYTTWSVCEAEQLPPEVIAELCATVSRAGFRQIPPEALDEAYTGCHPGFAGSTWFARFFEYL